MGTSWCDPLDRHLALGTDRDAADELAEDGGCGMYSVETATSMTHPIDGQSGEASTLGSNVTSTPSSP